jgi:hypothetical protein
MEMHRPMKPLGLALVVAALATLPSPAAAQDVPAPPENDHYLASFRVPPDGPLPRDTTLRTESDTTSATEQGDIFSPGPGGGGPEVTNCDGTEFGKTIWYRVEPDRPVAAQFTANAQGFDPVLAIYDLDPQTLRPRGAICSNRLTFGNEQLIVGLRRGGLYQLQVGGAGRAGGRVELLFDFFRLPRVDAAPRVVARATPSGIQIARFAVEADRGARVEVRCPRGGCPRLVRNASASASAWGPIGDNATMSRSAGPQATASRVVDFRRMRGRRFRARQTIEIRVTREGFLGRYFKYTIRRGGFTRTERCLEPGSSTPRRRCG